MPMNDNAQLYHDMNKLTRTHAKLYLEEFAPKFTWKEKGSRIIDVGSGDGSVNKILRSFLPHNYEILIGVDISENMVNFANNHYGDERTLFRELDIEGDLPEDLRESFDHVFSLYLFHWIIKQEKAFTNIYNLMTHDGECFMTFLGYTHAFSIFISLSKMDKWKHYLKDVQDIISPYHCIQDPDRKVREILQKIGFKNVDVRCKQTVIQYGPKELRDKTAAISPFKFPTQEMYDDFLHDYEQEARNMKLFDEDAGEFTFIYNLIVVYGTK